MLHSYLACMHIFLWFSNLHLTNLVCRGLVFADLVLANLWWTKSTLSLRCLSGLGEYGLNQVRILSFPSCLPKSRDEIFLRGGELSQPRKKKEKRK